MRHDKWSKKEMLQDYESPLGKYEYFEMFSIPKLRTISEQKKQNSPATKIIELHQVH